MISSPNKADGGAPAADGGAADQQTGLAKLETVLIARYGELRQHLTRRLGSQDWADEALQDTYLRLNKTEAVGDLHNPIAYLFRAALNVALNRNVDGSAECDGARLGYGGGDTRTPGEDGERQHKRGQDQEQGSYDPNSIFRVVGSGETDGRAEAEADQRGKGQPRVPVISDRKAACTRTPTRGSDEQRGIFIISGSGAVATVLAGNAASLTCSAPKRRPHTAVILRLYR